MNPGRGWNPELEESYIPEYSESEAETFRQGTSRIYLWSIKVLVVDLSPILRYNECTKNEPNQNFRSWSLNFDFEEEINPKLGSLKNSSSVKIPNFPH